MTNLIVISDIHGNLELLEIIKKRHESENPIFINCGDSCLELKDIEGIISVKGNCDKYDVPNNLMYSNNGVDMFITHGHLEQVKMDLNLLSKEASKCGAKLVLYGHTHIVKHDIINGIHFINPGSIEKPKRLFMYNDEVTTVPTYAKIILNNGTLECTFFHALNGNKITF